jgi:hypothetical protein
MKDNETILKQRMERYNKIKGAKVGEFLKYKKWYVRFSEDLGDSLQTSEGGSFYLGNGYMSFSGSLNHGIDKDKIELTPERRMGSVWFFDEDIAGAGRGKYFQVKLRVFKIKKGVKVDPYDILGRELLPEYKGETVCLYNGNNKRYTQQLPKLCILTKEINDTALKHIEKNTGLKFEQKGWCYSVQPTTSKQIVKLFLTYNFKTQYHDNIDTKNTILLKFDGDVGFKINAICYDCVKYNGITTTGLAKGDMLSC